MIPHETSTMSMQGPCTQVGESMILKLANYCQISRQIAFGKFDEGNLGGKTTPIRHFLIGKPNPVAVWAPSPSWPFIVSTTSNSGKITTTRNPKEMCFCLANLGPL